MSKPGSEGPPATSFEHPRKVGWLNKRGGSGMGAHWRKRWFIADHHYLFYYKTPNDKKPVGILCLPEYDSCHREDAKEWKKPNTFVLDRGNATQDSDASDNAPIKNYILSSESEEDMLSWIKAITEEIKPMIGGEERRPGGGGTVSNGRPPASKRKKTDGSVDPKAFDDVAALATEGPKLTHLTTSRPKVRNRRPPKRYVVFHEDDSKPEDQSPPSTPATPTSDRLTPPSVSPSASPQMTPKRGHRPSAPLLPSMMNKSPKNRRGTTKTESPSQKLKFRKPPPPVKKPPKEEPPSSSDQTLEADRTSPPTPQKPVPPRKPTKEHFTGESDTTLDAVPEEADSKQSRPVPTKRPRPIPPTKPRAGTVAEDVTPAEPPPTPTKRPTPAQRPVPVPRKRAATEQKPVLPEKELPPLPPTTSKIEELEEPKMAEQDEKTTTESAITANETVDSTLEHGSESEKTVELKTKEQTIELASEDELLDEEPSSVEAPVEETKKEANESEVVKKMAEDTNDQLYEVMEAEATPEDEVQTAYEPMSFDEEENSKHQEERPKLNRHDYDEVPTESFSSEVPLPKETDDSSKPPTVHIPATQGLSESELSDVIGSPGYIEMNPASSLHFKDRQGSVDEAGYEKMKLGIAKEQVDNSSSTVPPEPDHEYVEPTEWVLVPSVISVPTSDQYDVPSSRPLSDEQTSQKTTNELNSRNSTSPGPPRSNSTSLREDGSSVHHSETTSSPQNQTSAKERSGSFNETSAEKTVVAITVKEELSSTRSDQPSAIDRTESDSLNPLYLSHDSTGYTKVRKTAKKSAKHNGNTVESERLSSLSSNDDKEPPEIIPMMFPEDHIMSDSLPVSVPATLRQAKEILRLAQAVRIEADQMKKEAQRELELAKRERHDAELLKKNASEILRMAKEKFGVSSKK